MKKTLYLLRKPIEQINPTVFLPEESRGDVVLLGDSAGRMFPYAGGAILSLTNSDTAHDLTYDMLVTKIFECDHIVII